MARSRALYEEAVSLDPEFALARNALAEHFFALAANGIMAGREASLEVRSRARAALAIDPTLLEAHALLGLTAAAIDYDWDEAARQFQCATAVEPISSYVHWFHAQCLAQMGRYDDASAECERALSDDPLHLLCRSHLAQWLHAAGRYEEAAGQLRRVLDVDDRFWAANWYVGMFAALSDRLPEARSAAERAAAWAGNTAAIGLLAGIAARLGDANHADDLLGQLRSAKPYSAPVGWTVYHLVRHEQDEARRLAK